MEGFATVPGKHIFAPLKVDGTGSIDLNVDGTTPVKFDYIVINHTEDLVRLNLLSIDNANRVDRFGGLAVLTNGLKMEMIDTDNSVLVDFTNGSTIKRVVDFGLFAGIDVDPADEVGGAGDDVFNIRWTFAKGGARIRVSKGMRFRITVQDDLTGLTLFHAQIQGIMH